MTYQINEIFHSVQGEGLHTGKAATFIRLQGCTVGCPWCDSGPLADKIKDRFTNGETRNTWQRGGRRMEAAMIALEAYSHWNASDDAHFVVTGGEPTLYNLDDLFAALKMYRHEDGKWPYIQLETSGQNALKGELWPDWITWSPKKNLDYKAPESLLSHVNEIKFVVDEELDMRVVCDIEAHMFREYDFADIILMPEGCPPSPASMQKAYEAAIAHPSWRVMDRLQYRLHVR